MYVEQLFTGCLAEMAYYIESNGEAVVIDPLRETTPYIEKAHSRGAKIKYVFLTHFHADFVSGHVDLAKKTGATIVFGPNAKTAFDFHSGADGEEFKIGNITLKLLHTPGHTMESSSYLLIDAEGETPYIFTGDALFIGDVGRPDLAVKSDVTQEDLAGYLFDSLRNKIMTLPDGIIVYPAHGAGSACGKNMSKETFDTLGHQKEVNYALRVDMTKGEFVKEVTTGLVVPPQYFPKNVGMNKGITELGWMVIKELLNPSRGRRILIDMGYIPEALKKSVRKPQDVTIVGNILWPNEVDSFAPDPNMEKNIWFARDATNMARHFGTESFLIVARTIEVGDYGTIPQPIGLNIPNNHLEYAITWFSLALVWFGMTLYLLYHIKHKTV